MNPPAITINGTPLSDAQALAVRVACAVCFAQMRENPDALGDDAHGRSMTELYAARLGEVLTAAK